jgi:hypothetical protein
VRTARVSCWLAGLAAAGTAIGLQLAPVAGAAKATMTAAPCNAPGGVGVASQVKYRLQVNGTSLGRAVLHAGDMISTDSSGAVDICLVAGDIGCRMRGDTAAQVMPSNDVLLYISRSLKRVDCATTAGGSRKKLRTPQGTILVGARRSLSAAHSANPFFSVYVSREATVVQVIEGGVDVMTATQTRHVGEDQQLTLGKRHAVRSIWGMAKGRFRTAGRYSSAEVKG